MINSHIFIPRTILKAFAIKNTQGSWRTFYIKLPTLKIREGDIEQINTRRDEYDHEIETLFNQKYESSIAMLNQKVTKALRDKKGGTIENEFFDIDTIKNLFIFQMLRDEAILRTIYPNLTAETLRQLKNDLVQKEASDDFLKESFKDHKLIICINPNGDLLGCSFPIILAKQDEYEAFAMPISPYILLVLTNDFRKEIQLKYAQKAYYKIKPNEARYLNKQVLTVGKKKGLGYIVSKSQNTLKVLLN